MRHDYLIGMAALLLSAVTLPAAHAESRMSELTSYLESQVSSLDDAFTASPAEQAASEAPAESWYFRRTMIRLRPRATFSIPGALKLEITPEVELIWDRPLPAGWVAYKR